jgi:lysophospholipase L1-like esterase
MGALAFPVSGALATSAKTGVPGTRSGTKVEMGAGTPADRAAAPSTRVTGAEHWVAAWAAAPQAVSQHPRTPSFDRAPAVAGRTIRQIIYPRIAGDRVRLRLSNSYGTRPLRIDRVQIAAAASGAALAPGVSRAVTFAGKPIATIPPGAQLDSDPIGLPVESGAPLAVSVFVPDELPPTTWHKIGSQVNYMSAPGDHTGDLTGAAFAQRITSYLWLEGLSVDAARRPPAYAVVAIGDSITDGMRSTLNANRRWPDWFARRLAHGGQTGVSVIDLGISGNRLLNDSPCYGEKLIGRFARDALNQPGVRAAIVLIGINDINFAAMPARAGLDCDSPHAAVDAQGLIAGYQDLAAQAHRRGVRIYIGTLTPAGLPPDRESTRTAVNKWIRTQHVFDGIADFDAALRDPLGVTRMQPKFDSGDRVHPSDAGYAAMAEAVPLGWFEAK